MAKKQTEREASESASPTPAAHVLKTAESRYTAEQQKDLAELKSRFAETVREEITLEQKANRKRLEAGEMLSKIREIYFTDAKAGKATWALFKEVELPTLIGGNINKTTYYRHIDMYEKISVFGTPVVEAAKNLGIAFTPSKNSPFGQYTPVIDTVLDATNPPTSVKEAEEKLEQLKGKLIEFRDQNTAGGGGGGHMTPGERLMEMYENILHEFQMIEKDKGNEEARKWLRDLIAQLSAGAGFHPIAPAEKLRHGLKAFPTAKRITPAAGETNVHATA